MSTSNDTADGPGKVPPSLNDAAQLLRVLDEHFAQVETALDRVAQDRRTLPRGARDLLDATRLGLKREHSDLQAKLSEFDGFPANRRLARIVKKCGDLDAILRAITQSVLPVLEGARAHRIPVELESVLLSGVRKSAGDRWDIAAVVLYTDYDFNYKIRLVDFSEASLNWVPSLDERERHAVVTPSTSASEEPSDGSEEAAPPPPTKLVVLSAPSTHRDSVLLHSIMLGHELGHIRDWRHQVSQQFAAEIVAPEAKGEEEVSLGNWPVLGSWLREFSADAFAVHAIGPAALFALVTLELAHPQRVDSTSHPGTDRRIANMLHVLSELGYRDTDRDDLDHQLNALDEMSDGALERSIRPRAANARGLIEESWELMRGHLEGLRERVKGCQAGTAFGPDRWLSEIDPAVGSLAAGVPFGEFWNGEDLVEASNRAILNAAWMVRLTRLPDLASVLGYDSEVGIDKEAVAHSLRVLDDLVLKSFEIARFREQVLEWHRSQENEFKSG